MTASKPTIKEMMDDIGAKYGLVIMLDALGMRNIWESKDPKTVLDNYKALTNAAELKIVEDGRKYGIEFEVKVFSDTVLITGTCENILVLLLETPSILRTFFGIGLVMGFYFRGCMDLGLYFPSPKLVLGPAIAEAAYFHDKMEMIGILVNPKLRNKIIELMSRHQELKTDLGYYYTEYDVPMKDGIQKQWLMKHIPNSDISKIGFPSEKLGANTLLEFVKKKIEIHSNEKIKKKWENTLKFFEYTQ